MKFFIINQYKNFEMKNVLILQRYIQKLIY